MPPLTFPLLRRKTLQPLIPRSFYNTLSECIYMNQASLGLISEPAVLAMKNFLDDIARHGNLHMTDKQELRFSSELRTRAATLLHTEPSNIALVSGASEIMGLLPEMLRPHKGSKIVAISTDFPSVTRPWLRYASEHGCAINFVKDAPERDLTETLLENIDTETGVVTVSSVQYGTGTRIDIPKIRAATRELGIPLIVDATQQAGLLRVDATEWDAEVVITSGYKWLGGHGGIALAVMSPTLLQQSPSSPGWMGAESPFEMDATCGPESSKFLAPDARRYTQSTMSYISMAGLSAGLDVLLAVDEDDRENHSRELATELIHGVSQHGWTPFRGLDDSAASPHIISLGHENLDANAMVKAFHADGIVCSAREGRLRVSLAAYNDATDVEAVVCAFARNANIK